MSAPRLRTRAVNLLRAAIVYDGINIEGGHVSTAAIGRELVRRGYLRLDDRRLAWKGCPVWVITDAGRAALAAHEARCNWCGVEERYCNCGSGALFSP